MAETILLWHPPLRLQGQHGTTGTTETTGTAQTGREMVGRLARNSIPVDSALRRLGNGHSLPVTE